MFLLFSTLLLCSCLSNTQETNEPNAFQESQPNQVVRPSQNLEDKIGTISVYRFNKSEWIKWINWRAQEPLAQIPEITQSNHYLVRFFAPSYNYPAYAYLLPLQTELIKGYTGTTYDIKQRVFLDEPGLGAHLESSIIGEEIKTWSIPEKSLLKAWERVVADNSILQTNKIKFLKNGSFKGIFHGSNFEQNNRSYIKRTLEFAGVVNPTGSVKSTKTDIFEDFIIKCSYDGQFDYMTGPDYTGFNGGNNDCY